MNIKRIWPVIPTIILPYVVLGILATIFFSTGNGIANYIVEELFNGSIFFLLLGFVVFTAIAIVLNLIFCVFAYLKKWDAVSIAKTTTIAKLIRIPAYVCLFIYHWGCFFRFLLIL